MYGNPQMESDSKSKVSHKFFEKFLNNNLDDLQRFLEIQYGRIESGDLIKGPKNEQTAWDSSKSETTIQWNKYNVFQFYHPAIFQLFKSVREMTLEACKHYNLNFELEQFMVQGWFNINYNKKGKLDWHEHGGNGAPHFHGYYCVKAEPSTTHYRVFDKEIENINKKI